MAPTTQSTIFRAPEQRTLVAVFGGERIAVSWYVPGTGAAELRETLALRLGVPPAGFVLEDSSGVVTLSAGLPSGLELQARLVQPAASPQPLASLNVAASATTASCSERRLDMPSRLPLRAVHDTAPPAADGGSSAAARRLGCASGELSQLAEPLLCQGTEPHSPLAPLPPLEMRLLPPQNNGSDIHWSKIHEMAHGVSGSGSGAPEAAATIAAAARPVAAVGNGGGGDGGSGIFGLRNDVTDHSVREEVDAMLKLNRLTSFLANERTYLAWVRTACSMFALAISTLALTSKEQGAEWWLGWATGLMIACLSAVCYWHGVERYFRVKHVLSQREPPPGYGRRSMRPFSALVGAVWLAFMIAYVVRGLFLQHVII